MGVELEAMGCHSIGIKDMSGILTPRVAHDLVRDLKQEIGLPITLHTHDTPKLGAAACLASIDAGVGAVESSISPFANGIARPDTVRMPSNSRNQLAEQGMCGNFDEAVREIPVVREALGWIPFVTPTSQIVSSQAMRRLPGDDEREVRTVAGHLPTGSGHRTRPMRQNSGPDGSRPPRAGCRADRSFADHLTPG